MFMVTGWGSWRREFVDLFHFKAGPNVLLLDQDEVIFLFNQNELLVFGTLQFISASDRIDRVCSTKS